MWKIKTERENIVFDGVIGTCTIADRKGIAERKRIKNCTAAMNLITMHPWFVCKSKNKTRKPLSIRPNPVPPERIPPPPLSGPCQHFSQFARPQAPHHRVTPATGWSLGRCQSRPGWGWGRMGCGRGGAGPQCPHPYDVRSPAGRPCQRILTGDGHHNLRWENEPPHPRRRSPAPYRFGPLAQPSAPPPKGCPGQARGGGWGLEGPR